MNNNDLLQVGCFVLLGRNTLIAKRGYWYKVIEFDHQHIRTSKGALHRNNIKAVKYPWTPIQDPNPDLRYIVEYEDGAISMPILGDRNTQHRNELLQVAAPINFSRFPFIPLQETVNVRPRPWSPVRMKIAPVYADGSLYITGETKEQVRRVRTKEERAINRELVITL